MKIEVKRGDKFLCITNKVDAKKGKIYPAFNEKYIDVLGFGTDLYPISHDVFQPLSSAKWAIKRTPENADVVNKWANENKLESDSGNYIANDGFIHSDDVPCKITVCYKSGYKIREGYTEIDFETFKEITGVGEEVPKHLLGEKEAVHCPTLELAEKVLEILKHGGKSPSFAASVYFNEKGIELCFRKFGYFGYAHKDFYEREGYTIIPAEQFIKGNEQKIFTIEDVRNGKCAIENDGTSVDLAKLSKYFNDPPVSYLQAKYHWKGKENWIFSNEKPSMPTQSVKLFLSQIDGKEQPTEEWQPKWGEPVEVSDDGSDWVVGEFVGLSPSNNRPVVEYDLNESFSCTNSFRYIRQPIHTFTTEQAKQDLAKFHNLKPEQIKITD